MDFAMQFNEKGEDDLMGAVSKVDMVVEEAHQLGSDCELSDGSGRILEMNRESYHHHPGATKDSRGCEDCEEEGKAAPAGSLRVRKCHACDRKKDLAERRYANNLQDREDIQTMDNQSASGAVEEFLPVINNMACSNNVGDGGVRIICTDSFSMVHEHTDVCAGETVSSTPSEEAERVLRRREILRTVKKESRTLLAAAAAAGIDPAAPAVDRKEKVCSGYSNAYTRAKMLHEKEIAALNERRDQELEEQELEKRERGWVTIGNGPVPKTVPTKNTSAVEVINPVGREPKERAFNKLRSLREKPDTQRVLGLVARRSESRVTSPTHRRIDTTERDEQHANLDHVISSSDSQRKLETKVETTSPGQTDNSTTTTTTLIRNEDDMVSAANGEGEPKPFRTSSERAISNPKPSSEMPSRQNSGSNRSSPRSSSCRVNDNPLYGTNSDVEPAACACNGVVANPAQLYSRQSSSLQPVAHSRVAVLTKPPETGSSSQTGEQKKNKKSSSFSSPKTTPSYMTPVPSPSFQSASASPACRSPEPTKQQTIAKTSFPLEHVGVQGAVEIVADEERSSSSTCGRSSKEKVRVIQLRGGGGDEQKNCTGFVDSRKFSSSRPCPGATLCKKVLENQQEVGSKLQPEVVPSKGCRPWKSIVLWPAHKTYQALAFQLKVAAKLLFFLTWMLKSILYGFGKALFMPVVILSTVANMVVSWITWPFGCIDRGRYSGCECLAKTYILLVLSSLFLPSLFDFDFFLVHKFVEGEVVIREGLHFDYTKTHPVAVVHVLPQHIIHRSKGFSFNLPDKEVMAARAFPASHKFQVTVHLTVPESEYNHQIGMFQVVAETFSVRGHSLEKASRPSMLRYHSPPVRIAKSLLMGMPVVAETFSVRGHSLEKASRPSMLRYHSPPVRIAKSLLMGMPVLLGLCQESQTISVRVMDSQEEQELNPTATIRVVLEPKAGNVIGTGVPEIYKAELQVVSHLPWMRDVARSWVWSLYLYSGLGLLLFDALLVMCCCRRLNPKKPENMSNVHSEGKVLKDIPERGVTNLPGILNNRQSLSQKGFVLASPSSSNALDDIRVDDMQIGKQLLLIKA